MRYRLLACCSLLVCSIAFQPSAAQTTSAQQPTVQTLRGRDFESGSRDGVTSSPDGLETDSSHGVYTSPITAAPRIFNYILLRWEATVPVSVSLEVEGRVSPDGQAWSEWGHFDASDDLRDARDPDTSYWSNIVFAGESRFWQVRTALTASPQGEAPTLHSLTVLTVDTRDATAPSSPDGRSVGPAGALTRPSYVSRWGWGGQEVANNSVAADYYRASHLVVHHTADSNSLLNGESNWAARVRAIWRFHTYDSGRGWGDVGYNWLIDPNGVVYEGRRGSSETDRDAVAFHDTANRGSMGVVLIGTYNSVTPTSAAQETLINLLAWKAQQRQIDPYGSSYYYGCQQSRFCAPHHNGAIVPNLLGHRQVTPGHTSCPGDRGIDILPNVRARVAAMLSPTDNGDTVVDDMESGFSRLAGSWNTAPVGYDGHTYYTFATNGAAENTARWTPNLPQAGRYKVEAHIPQNTGMSERPTDNARYRISHAIGQDTIAVSQANSQQWHDLGVYQFNAGTGGNVYLEDVTGEPYSSTNRRPIFFDAIRWSFIPEAEPQIELVDVSVSPSSIEAGEVMRVAFTVRNTGTMPIASQDPEPGRTDDLTRGYVYDERECYLSNSGQTYPTFAPSTGQFRVVLRGSEGGTALGDDCGGDVQGYAWRWGLGSDLQPGESRTIVGAVRMHNYTTSARTINLSAGLVQENMRFVVRDRALGPFTVHPERRAPRLSEMDSKGQPLARVYTLKSMPQSLLARTSNPLSIVGDRSLGTFAWDGTTVNWEAGGPFGQSNLFMVEQVRPFFVENAGVYTFRLETDDGSWLWIDGNLVIDNHGMHGATPATAAIYLSAGMHVLGFKYFEYSGPAQAGYSWQASGTSIWSTIPNPPVSAVTDSGIMLGPKQQLAVAADDMGGAGVASLRYTLDNGEEQTTTQPMFVFNGLLDGPHTLRFRAFDNAANAAASQSITFTVNTTPPYTTLGAEVMPSGPIKLSWMSSPDSRTYTVEVFDTSLSTWRNLTTTTATSTVFFGELGRSYQFRVIADDGVFKAPSNTTASHTVPSNAIFYRQYLPFSAR